MEQSAKENALEDIKDIFATLHDGVIYEWAGDREKLTLKVGCQYLAELIDPAFDDFVLELEGVNQLVLAPWMDIEKQEQEYITDWLILFKHELEILYAEIDNALVKISCRLGSLDFDYSGGTLYVSCNAIKIFDQNKNELTVDHIDQVSNKYWDAFEQKGAASRFR
jgi:hypothetical protein